MCAIVHACGIIVMSLVSVSGNNIHDRLYMQRMAIATDRQNHLMSISSNKQVSRYITHRVNCKYDTIDDLHWKTDRQAASLIWFIN